MLTLNGKVERVGFDRDERSVLTIHRTTEPRTVAVRAWDLESGRERPERSVDRVADAFTLMPTGDLVLAKDDARGGGRGGSVVVEGGVNMEVRYEGDVERILVSQDGQHVAVSSSLGGSASTVVSPGRHQVIVLHLATRARVLKFDYTTAERDNSLPTAFFILGNRWYLGVDDGQTMNTGGRRSTFVLWDMKSGEKRLERSDDILRLWREDIASSGDGRLKALESGDEIRVFTAGEEREIARIPIALVDKDPFRLSTTFVAMSTRGRYVAAITAKNRVRVWPVDASLLRSVSCSRLSRELSPEEWSTFLPSEGPEPACRR